MNHLPKIIFEVIPHKKQRYPTCGDYFKKNGKLNIKVSKMSFKYELLVLVHELIEWSLIEEKGISINSIDDFDILFEEKRTDNSEPGNDPDAPYYEEHQFATSIEKLLAKKLRVNWTEYDKYVNSLA